jgi:hypothetical protein
MQITLAKNQKSFFKPQELTQDHDLPHSGHWTS